MTTTKRIAALAVGALVLTGCGSDDESPPASARRTPHEAIDTCVAEATGGRFVTVTCEDGDGEQVSRGHGKRVVIRL